jgi:hypothetical protein
MIICLILSNICHSISPFNDLTFALKLSARLLVTYIVYLADDAYPDGIHVLDPSDSQSSPLLRGIINTLDGCTNSTTIGVDLVEAEPSPPPGGGGGGRGSSVADDAIR